MNLRKLRLQLSPKRFTVQLIVIFVAFTLGTILALGIPATLVLEHQTQTQLKALLDQAERTTQALLENKLDQLHNLSFLLAQRPTLKSLLATNADSNTLQLYLDSLQSNSGFEAILICTGETALASASSVDTTGLCEAISTDVLITVNGTLWMVTQTTLESEYEIVVGQQLSSVFDEFTAQSGLDYVFFMDKDLVTTNLSVTGADLADLIPNDLTDYQILSLTGENGEIQKLMVKTLKGFANSNEQWLAFLDVSPYIQANRQLHEIIILVLALISLIAAGLAVLISRRISRPLNVLAQSAARLREGDLTFQLNTVSNLWEIDQLANALEDARVSLKHSLEQLQKEKIWIEGLLNAIVEGLITLDNRHRVTFASASTFRLTGKAPAEIIGFPIDEILTTMPGEDRFSQQIPLTDQVRRIPVLLGKNEFLLAVSRSEFFPPDAGNATTALVIRDVSDEERIHHLIGEFMANITHEFRTPLAALSASVELLVDQLPDLTPPEIEKLLHTINIGIVNLQSLIDNLIEAASIEGGRFKVNPQPVAFGEIVGDAILTMEPIARLHKVTIQRPDPKQDTIVRADKRRTVQVLINLISNAIKHSPEEGQITIRTLLVEKAIMVEVQDQGSGIPENLHNQVFNRFLTPKSAEDAPQLGLGLGLSVVKAIVEAQSGQVGYRNAENGGALFWFTLPTASGGE
ncbi:MAG: HAMP domain-containing protein [Anaerolineaceae bacterium]|nr:HAMP domain-containing protein [Anaerolineaceae bacterium]